MSNQFQTAYSEFHDEAFPGMKCDSRYDEVESYVAQSAIDFGNGVVKALGAAKSVRLPCRNQAVLTWSGNFVASNVINGKVNGVAIAPVTYATSDAATQTALAAVIAAMDGVKSATAGTNKITVVFDDDTSGTLTDWVVTLGSGQVTASIGYSSLDIYRGCALHRHKEKTTSEVAAFGQYDSVGVQRKGKSWVPVSHAVSEDDAVYLDCGVGKEGLYTNQSTSDAGATANILTLGKFRSDSKTMAISGTVIAQMSDGLV